MVSLRWWCRVVLVASLGLGGVAQAQDAWAQASSSVRVARKNLRERQHSWRVLVRLELAKAPEQAEQSFRFVLTQHVDFVKPTQPSRDAGNAGKGKGRPPRVRQPVRPPRVLEIAKTLDLTDVKGNVGKLTRTELTMSQAAGFRAGEWALVVYGPAGKMNAPLSLVLDGVNAAPIDSEKPSDKPGEKKK